MTTPRAITTLQDGLLPVGSPSRNGHAAGVNGQQPFVELPESVRRRYGKLQSILSAPRGMRDCLVRAAARELQCSTRTVRRWLQRLDAGGGLAASLADRRGGEKGPRLPDAVGEWFVSRRCCDEHREETVANAIRAARAAFPGQQVSAWSLRRLDQQIPRALRMGQREYTRTYGPAPKMQRPAPNAVWQADFTLADVLVQNPQGPRAVRPYVTAIVDRGSASVMSLIYHLEHHDQSAVAAALLHAALWKRPGWPQCGLPEVLRVDNGWEFTGAWLNQVAAYSQETFPPGFRLSVATPYEPWGKGQVERFFRDLHEQFESRFTGCYTGKGTESKPESLDYDNAGKPTVEVLNERAARWVAEEYHHARHRDLGCSRNEYWLQHCAPVRRPDEDLWRTLLMRRETRIVQRARVSLHRMVYYHPALVAQDGREVVVRWDPFDLGEVIVCNRQGQELCRAELERPYDETDPRSLAELKRRRAERMALRRHALQFLSRFGDGQQAVALAQFEAIAKGATRPALRATAAASNGAAVAALPPPDKEYLLGLSVLQALQEQVAVPQEAAKDADIPHTWGVPAHEWERQRR